MLKKSIIHMKNLFLFISFSLLVSSCSIPNMVVIELESKSSSETNGFVVFIEDDSKVTMEATINNLEPENMQFIFMKNQIVLLMMVNLLVVIGIQL